MKIFCTDDRYGRPAGGTGYSGIATAIQKFIKTASPVVLNALWHIALALVIFFVGRWLIEKFLSRVALLDNKTKIDPGVAKFVRSLVRVALWALLIYFIADFLGVPTASFVALLGSIGVTVGLALQGSLSNFAGGLILMFLHPFKTGDTSKLLRISRGRWWRSGCSLPRCAWPITKSSPFPTGISRPGILSTIMYCRCGGFPPRWALPMRPTRPGH